MLKHLPLNKIAVAIAGRVHTPEQILLRTARNKTGKTQQAFAELITPPVATLRDWEQGRFSPSGAVICLLHLINNHPDMIDELSQINNN